MNRQCYWFGPYRLDSDRRALYRGATCYPLTERLYRILLALVEADGDYVSREELAQRVWGSDGVTDMNLTQHIHLLRSAMGERRGDVSHILTIPGRGYRLAAPVSVVPYELAVVGSDALLNYCRGNYLLERRAERALRGAVIAFEAALGADAAFVPALVGLARAWMLLSEYWHEPPSTAMPKAQLYIERALELDPRSAAALSALSEVQLCGYWDWKTSRRNLDAALSVDPGLTFARNNAAWYHLYRGEFHEAAAETREALSNQPASLTLQLLYARIQSHAGKHDDAIAGISNILELDPQFVFARRFLTMAYLLGGYPERALDAITSESSDDSEDAVYRLPMLACTWSKLGEPEKAHLAYEQLRAMSRHRYVSSWSLAMAAANSGHDDEALALLRDAEGQRDSALLLLPILPVFGALEKRADFGTLVRTVAA